MPEVYKTDLDKLLAGTTFLGAEQADTRPSRSKLSKVLGEVFFWVYGGLIYLGTLAGVGHGIWLVYRTEQWPLTAVVAVGIIGVLLWFRGASLVAEAVGVKNA